MRAKKTIGKVYAETKINKKPESVSEEIIPENDLIREDRLSRVGVSCGLTINIGDYNSARIGIWIELPCDISKIDDSYEKAFKIVTEKLIKEVDKIKDWRNVKISTAADIKDKGDI